MGTGTAWGQGARPRGGPAAVRSPGRRAHPAPPCWARRAPALPADFSLQTGTTVADGRHRALGDEAAASPWRRALEGGCVRAARPSLLPPLFLGPGHRGCCCCQWQRSLNPPPRLRTQGWKAARHPRPYPQTPTAEGLSRTQGAACRTHGQGQ